MRSSTMLRYITLRLTFSAVLSVTLLPAASFAQSHDTQSVAEAARKARAQKKNTEKAPKVITEETLDVKKGDVQSATAEQPRIPGTPETQAQSTPANAPSSAVQSEKKASEDEKLAKELAALKEQIKQAQGDLELLQREQSLEQDNHYSKTDYAHDTAGKAKLDSLKQQISEKQQELERLKARLAELQLARNGSASTPPKP